VAPRGRKRRPPQSRLMGGGGAGRPVGVGGRREVVGGGAGRGSGRRGRGRTTTGPRGSGVRAGSKGVRPSPGRRPSRSSPRLPTKGARGRWRAIGLAGARQCVRRHVRRLWATPLAPPIGEVELRGSPTGLLEAHILRRICHVSLVSAPFQRTLPADPTSADQSQRSDSRSAAVPESAGGGIPHPERAQVAHWSDTPRRV